jgi:CDP-diacylglycerol--serine O-phosphatidyltransferase
MKHIPNLFTLLNLVFGCCAIVLILQQGISLTNYDEGTLWVMMPQAVWQSSLFIFLAAVVDFLDGFIARLLKADSEMGKQLDSLADVVSFGVAPSLIIYHFIRVGLASEAEGLDKSMLWLVPSFVLAAAAAWRLARFNISTDQQHGFKGMPTPAVGLLVASFPLIYWNSETPVITELFHNKWIWYALIVLLSYLMVSDLPLMAFKFGKGRKQVLIPLLILFTLSLVAAIFLQWWAVPVAFVLYISLSLIYKQKVNL